MTLFRSGGRFGLPSCRRCRRKPDRQGRRDGATLVARHRCCATFAAHKPLSLTQTRTSTTTPSHERNADEATCGRSEEHTSELPSLMRISYAVFCLNKTKHTIQKNR